MKLLITGANGYIGARLTLVLAETGHDIVALVRSAKRFFIPKHLENKIQVHEATLLDAATLANLPKDIDAAYYLVHSMGQTSKGFSSTEETCAINFVRALEKTDAKQVIYLSALCHDPSSSEHLSSRQQVERVLKNSTIPLTALRASVIIGSGSASFDIVYDLVEKLPIMITPKWVGSKCQPIAVSDVLYYLQNTLLNKRCMGKILEIGGPDVLTYKEVLLEFAKIRGLRRIVIVLSVMSIRLSSLWLFLVTSTSFSIAKALIYSLKVDTVVKNPEILDIFPHKCISYKEAVEQALDKIAQNGVISSWKDAMVLSHLTPNLSSYVQAPMSGFREKHTMTTSKRTREEVLEKLWSIGGDNGWYYMEWAWSFRGKLDRLVGGVGLRRGRTHPTEIKRGDALDFWRVIFADKEGGYLLLYAEMKTPGEGWIEWKIEEKEEQVQVTQTATFRPRGLLGRLYWYLAAPFHLFIFKGLCQKIIEAAPQKKERKKRRRKIHLR